MPKKPTRRKRQQGKRRASVHRARLPQPARPAPGPPAPGTGRGPLLAELEAMLLAAAQNGEFLVPDPDDHDDLWDGDSDDDDDWDEPEPKDDFEPEAEHLVLTAIHQICATGTARPADDLVRRLSECEQRLRLAPGDGSLVGEMVAVSILLDVRYGPAPPDAVAAVGWITDRLGVEPGRRALGVADLLGHPDAPPWSTVHPPRDGTASLLPALTLLLAGVVGAET